MLFRSMINCKISLLLVSCILGLSLAQQATLPNCKVMDGAKCRECNAGFYLNNAGACSANCKAPCDKCDDSNPTVCLSCIQSFPAYFLAATNCLRCPAECVACKSTNQCDTCISTGFFKDSFSQICKACPANCNKCQQSDVCDTCNAGYGRLEVTVNGKKSVGCSTIAQGLGIIVTILVVLAVICILIVVFWCVCIYYCAKGASSHSHQATYEVQPAHHVHVNDGY